MGDNGRRRRRVQREAPGGIMQSGVAVVVLHVGVQFVVFEKDGSQLLVAPIRRLVQRASAAAALKRVYVSFTSKSSYLIEKSFAVCGSSLAY